MNRFDIIRVFLLLTVFVVKTSTLDAQNVWKVDTVYLKDSDLRNDYKDKWNNPMAKIEIPITLKGVEVDETERAVDSTWVDKGRIFVLLYTGERQNSPKITLLHDDFPPLRIVFSDFGIDKVEGKKVYVVNVEVHNGEKIKKPVDYNPKFKIYLGAGFNPMLQLAPIANIGFDCHRVNVWLSASLLNLTTSDDAYVYNSANELLGKHNYHYLRLGLNVGYEFELWKRGFPLCGIMPQLGIAWDKVSSRKSISGNGFNAYKFVAGARLALKTNDRHWCFFATPELNFNLGSKPSNNFDNITQSISDLKKSFDVQVGVLYYF